MMLPVQGERGDDDGRVPSAPGSQGSAPQPPTASSPAGADPSRALDQFHLAQERARAIAKVAERAAPAERAAQWLFQYGPNCIGKDAGAVSWTPVFANACPGAKEAAQYIRDAIMMMLPTIIAEAGDLAEADMHRLMHLLPSDSDGSPKGGDAEGGSVHDGAGPEGHRP
jgi:hypothetical protein